MSLLQSNCRQLQPGLSLLRSIKRKKAAQPALKREYGVTGALLYDQQCEALKALAMGTATLKGPPLCRDPTWGYLRLCDQADPVILLQRYEDIFDTDHIKL